MKASYFFLAFLWFFIDMKNQPSFIPKEIDLTIIGGSFAGLECGRIGAMRGLRTLVLERKSEPGIHPHTTGLLVKEVDETYSHP